MTNPLSIVVTGATDGVGRATAIELAKRGHRVILHGRSRPKLDEALDAARSAATNAQRNGSVSGILADFSSLHEVRNLAKGLQAQGPIDVLINNAGAMFAQRGTTHDGFERNFGINYLAPTLLTLDLLDHLSSRPSSRVINLSSVGYKSAKPDFDDLQTSIDYNMQKAYFTSKLFNLYFTLSLADRLGPRAPMVTAVHPGGVRSQLARDFKGPMKVLFSLMMPLFFVSPAKGAETSVFAALDPGVTLSGGYFVKSKPETLTAIGNNVENRNRLWERMTEMFIAQFPGWKCPDILRQTLSNVG